MISYQVKCPSDPYNNTSTHRLDKAMDLCYELAQEYGYAEVGYYNHKGHYQLIADYTEA